MNREEQDKLWSALSEDHKKTLRREYQDFIDTINEKDGSDEEIAKIEGKKHTLWALFGSHNLKPESDDQMEPSLTEEEQRLTKLKEWLRKEWYYSSHVKYRRYFEEWWENITDNQIFHFSRMMYNQENGVLNNQTKRTKK